MGEGPSAETPTDCKNEETNSAKHAHYSLTSSMGILIPSSSFIKMSYNKTGKNQFLSYYHCLFLLGMLYGVEKMRFLAHPQNPSCLLHLKKINHNMNVVIRDSFYGIQVFSHVFSIIYHYSSEKGNILSYFQTDLCDHRRP